VARPVQALIGLGIVASGLPAYFVWTWLARRSPGSDVVAP